MRKVCYARVEEAAGRVIVYLSKEDNRPVSVCIDDHELVCANKIQMNYDTENRIWVVSFQIRTTDVKVIEELE